MYLANINHRAKQSSLFHFLLGANPPNYDCHFMHSDSNPTFYQMQQWPTTSL